MGVAEKQTHQDVHEKGQHGREKGCASQRQYGDQTRRRERGGKICIREKQRKRERMTEELDIHRGFLLCSLSLCVWLQMFWYCLKIDWFGITAVNIFLSFDGHPRGG